MLYLVHLYIFLYYQIPNYSAMPQQPGICRLVDYCMSLFVEVFLAHYYNTFYGHLQFFLLTFLGREQFTTIGRCGGSGGGVGGAM